MNFAREKYYGKAGYVAEIVELNPPWPRKANKGHLKNRFRLRRIEADSVIS